MSKKSTSLILITLLSSGLALVGCGDDDSDDPTGAWVFITSATFDGNLGGLDGADDLCTNAAQAAGQNGTWTAWLSDNVGVDAIDRIVDADEYRLLDGTVVANGQADLTDGSLAHAIDMDENQNTVIQGFNSIVWTATGADGTNPGVGVCNAAAGDPAWTSNSDTRSGHVGDVFTDEKWTTIGGWDCSDGNRLYCFSDDEFDL